MDFEARLGRFEQQLDAFEKLHADELKKFQEKLAAYLRLQADEVKFLREELAALQKELAERETPEASITPVSRPKPARPALANTAPEAARLTRREFLGGGNPRQG